MTESVSRAQEARQNLRRERELRVAGRQATVGLKPWQIVKLQLERGGQP
jgi:hypothetical protein